MSNRSAKFVSALFASILAGANFAAVAENDTKAVAENGTKTAENGTKTADNCLSGPKGAAPAGSHWYYRIDRPTKRKCWYVGEEKNKTAKAAATQESAPQESLSSSSAEAANSVPPQQNAGVSKSVANARAEWPSPQSSVTQDASVTAAVPTSDDTQRTIAPDGTQSPSLVTSRWPDSVDASSSNDPRLAVADQAASPQPNATAPAQPAVTAVAPAAANSPLERQSGSVQTLLMVMASALAFVGLVGTVIFRFGRRTPVALAEVPDGHRAPWNSIPIDRPQRPMYVNQDAPFRRTDPARDPRAPDDPERQIAEMLRRLSRSATA